MNGDEGVRVAVRPSYPLLPIRTLSYPPSY